MQSAKNILVNATVAIVTIAALVAVGLRTRQAIASHTGQQNRHPIAVKDWSQYATAGHRQGPADAKVTIVEFADFQCPFCAKTSAELSEIYRHNPGEVAIVFRHFPLSIHPFAGAAAQASECAGREGKFQAYHDLLYSAQAEIGIESWSGFARRAGVVNIAAFESCLSDETVTKVILRDRAAGLALGVTGTPTLLVNGIEAVGYDGGNGQLPEIVHLALVGKGSNANQY